MTRRFDTVLMVDWSARSAPSPRRPSADAIWIGSAGAGAEEPRYFRTRRAACVHLRDRLLRALAEGRRVLAGFDVPFGYPHGLAAALTGRAEALALWAHLAALIEDGPDNRNNRFEVAAALNQRLPGVGPFWGKPAARVLPALPARGGARRGHGLAERRLVEARVATAQPVWKLLGAGAVGGQALTGLPALERLRRDPALAPRLAVWPFDTGLAPPEAPLVFAEVYPSLLSAEIAARAAVGEVRDAAQVRVLAEAVAALDARGGLGPLFAAAPDLAPDERARVAREEGWILGVGHEAGLRAAARGTLAEAA